LTSALVGGERLASCHGHFTLGERTPGIYWIGAGWAREQSIKIKEQTTRNDNLKRICMSKKHYSDVYIVVCLMTDVTEMVKCMISFSLIICTVYYGLVMCDASICI
jgi:hypothetical protein